MTPKLILAGVLVVAVLAAWARLVLRRRSAPRAPMWRFALLMAAQPVCAALLFLCLFPPATRVASGTLTIATAGAPRTAVSTTGARLIALPEAPDLAGAEHVPDLGTALRRHPGVRSIRVIGAGLTTRDRDAAQGLAVAFDPPPAPRGVVALQPPIRVAPGAGFQAGGQVSGLTGASVDLIDPAGHVTDTQKTDADGRFVLSGTARAAGPATFVVRVRDVAGQTVEQADLPVLVEGDAAPRLLIMAGAPGPEVKYLRRWATDAGFDVVTRMSAGGGIELGDAPVAINAAILRRFDAAVIDDRSWAGLGGQRGEVLSAVRDGMGLVLRSGGALDDATRGQWRSLGFSLTGGSGLAPVVLPAAMDADILKTRRGIPAADAGADLDLGEDIVPEISRLAVTPSGGDVVPLLRDGGGATLSAWRSVGRGRVAVFTGVDSFGLILVGRGDLYGDWWSGMLSAVARPTGGASPAFSGTAWAGERVVLCGLSPGARVERPDGGATMLQTGSGAPGCAGFWPDAAGWHLLRTSAVDGAERVWPFHVQPADRLPGVRAMRDRDATMMLSRTSAAASGAGTQDIPGSSWPWFLAWLVVSAGLWWFERSGRGRLTARTTEDAVTPE